MNYILAMVIVNTQTGEPMTSVAIRHVRVNLENTHVPPDQLPAVMEIRFPDSMREEDNLIIDVPASPEPREAPERAPSVVIMSPPPPPISDSLPVSASAFSVPTARPAVSKPTAPPAARADTPALSVTLLTPPTTPKESVPAATSRPSALRDSIAAAVHAVIHGEPPSGPPPAKKQCPPKKTRENIPTGSASSASAGSSKGVPTISNKRAAPVAAVPASKRVPERSTAPPLLTTIARAAGVNSRAPPTSGANTTTSSGSSSVQVSAPATNNTISLENRTEEANMSTDDEHVYEIMNPTPGQVDHDWSAVMDDVHYHTPDLQRAPRLVKTSEIADKFYRKATIANRLRKRDVDGLNKLMENIRATSSTTANHHLRGTATYLLSSDRKTFVSVLQHSGGSCKLAWRNGVHTCFSSYGKIKAVSYDWPSRSLVFHSFGTLPAVGLYVMVAFRTEYNRVKEGAPENVPATIINHGLDSCRENVGMKRRRYLPEGDVLKLQGGEWLRSTAAAAHRKLQHSGPDVRKDILQDAFHPCTGVSVLEEIPTRPLPYDADFFCLVPGSTLAEKIRLLSLNESCLWYNRAYSMRAVHQLMNYYLSSETDPAKLNHIYSESFQSVQKLKTLTCLSQIWMVCRVEASFVIHRLELDEMARVY